MSQKPKDNPVGERLRRYREGCALSQQQVADALLIDRTTYTKYETGSIEPNLGFIVKLASIFNVSPVDLLPMEEAVKKPLRNLKDTLPADSPIYQLSKEERGLIALFRVLNKEKRKEAKQLIANLSKKATDSSAK